MARPDAEAGLGAAWVWSAVDQDSRLFVSWHVGKRDQDGKRGADSGCAPQNGDKGPVGAALREKAGGVKSELVDFVGTQVHG